MRSLPCGVVWPPPHAPQRAPASGLEPHRAIDGASGAFVTPAAPAAPRRRCAAWLYMPEYGNYGGGVGPMREQSDRLPAVALQKLKRQNFELWREKMRGQRGRRSAASLTVTPSGEAVPRQRAPSNLTRDEVSVWNGIVSAEPADWFSGSTRPLLVQYCRHIIAARRVAAMIETLHAGVEAKAVAEQSGVMTMMLAATKALDRLQRMQDRETRALTSLATKMRITQQSTRTHRGNRIESRKPWEF